MRFSFTKQDLVGEFLNSDFVHFEYDILFKKGRLSFRTEAGGRV
jgi:hypothetical protein